jgi:hypothetical protein
MDAMLLYGGTGNVYTHTLDVTMITTDILKPINKTARLGNDAYIGEVDEYV